MNYNIKKKLYPFISNGLNIFHSKRCGVRVLLYHSIGSKDKGDTLGLRIAEGDFYNQMEYLKIGGYSVIPLRYLRETLEAKGTLPEKAVVITFDDGYTDNFTKGINILKEFNFPVTIFVTCKHDVYNLSSNQYWLKWGYITLEELENISYQNLAIGSHSLYHNMLNITKKEIYTNLSKSKEILEQYTGSHIYDFSYPNGIFNNKVKELLKETGYRSACCSVTGVNDICSDIFELKRTEITAFDTIFDFEKKLSGCYDWVGYFQRGRYIKE